MVNTKSYCTSKQLQANRGRFFLGVSKFNEMGVIYQELIPTFDLIQRIRLGPVNIQHEKPCSDP